MRYLKIIFDIGANTGNFTNECSITYPDAKIIAVEPNDNLVVSLRDRFKNNKNIIVLNNLVSTHNNQDIDFYINQCNTISTASKYWIENSRFSSMYSKSKIIKKQTINIDQIIKLYGNPDLIKIDVEGYELEVIQGLSSKQSEICFEWTEENYSNLNKTCQHLENIGYTDFGFIYNDNHLKRPDNYTPWLECDIHKDINISRKEKWGMVWTK